MKLIFLDIDGVLNSHGQLDFEPDCIEQFNRILAATEARVVLSSSWRYLMLDQEGCPKSMTLSGFATMLRTHHVKGLHLIGHTEPDEAIGDEGPFRGPLIRKWMKDNRHKEWQRYVVIDDDNDGISECSLPFVMTDGNKGLTVESANDVIRALNRDV